MSLIYNSHIQFPEARRILSAKWVFGSLQRTLWLLSLEKMQSTGIVEKQCDAAHFWSEITVRDAAMDLVSVLSGLQRSSHQYETRYGKDLFSEKPMKVKVEEAGEGGENIRL